MVKKNQPGLYSPVKNLPWRQVPGRLHPACPRARPAGAPTLQVTAVAAGIAFPHAARAIRLTRRIRPLNGGKWRTVTVCAITSLHAVRATPAQLADRIRGHRQIQALHHIRDVSYGEDASQIRAGNGPQVMATLRNLVIAIMKLSGTRNIAAACRYHARDATRTRTTPGFSSA